MARHDDFAEYFAARFDMARRTAYTLCGDWVDAEEIAQHAFVRMYTRWAKVRSDTADAYLRTVLTRVFLDGKRRNRRREVIQAEPPEQTVQPDTAATEDRQALLAALHQVPAKQRAALVLRFVHDLSVEQTAQALGCSVGTVKSQTARGLRTLREAYRRADVELSVTKTPECA